MESHQRVCSCLKCDGKVVDKRTMYSHAKRIHTIKSEHHAQNDNKSTTMEVPPTSSKDNAKLVELTQPLHKGTNVTVSEAIAQHLFIFASNNGLSKGALSMCLQQQKAILPQPNKLPSSYYEAVSMIEPLLMPIQRFKCCINDCKIFPIDIDVNSCSVCSESLSFSNNRHKKTFQYMPIVPRIVRWYGEKNLARILYANQMSTTGKLQGYTDGNIFKQHLSDGVFKDFDQENCVPLALFADGVNPNKNQTVQKSIWPLLITWITLPQELRYTLGPMMLAGIVPGYGRKEPKSLDPYVNVLVDELLANMETPLYNSYTDAPVNVKIALLQYLCDIPAFSKLLHCSSQAAIRACFFCNDIGIYNSSLSKVLHVSNRQFIPHDSPLRLDRKSFAKKSVEASPKPKPYTREEEVKLRQEYDKKPNNHQKSKHQKETGLKGLHPFHSLPYFDRMKQMQPDGMHTLADIIGNVMDLITGKSDSVKVRQCEQEFNRFKETWINKRQATPTTTEPPSKRSKCSLSSSISVQDPSTSTKPNLPKAPWLLTKEGLKLADKRALSIKYTKGFDYTPADHFSRLWTLRTMHGKQQFVTQNIAAWCIRGLLGPQQEETLLHLFEIIKRLSMPSYNKEDLPQLMTDTSIAVTLLERDFPLTLQRREKIHRMVREISENSLMAISTENLTSDISIYMDQDPQLRPLLRERKK